MDMEREQTERYEQWYWSAEGINDRLMYLGEDLDLRTIIIDTLQRLPRDVARFALEHCRFVSVGRATLGITLPGRVGTSSHHRQTSWRVIPAYLHRLLGISDREETSEHIWIIVLDERMAFDDVQSVIAHEIAHAWLGHDRLGNPPEDCEVQTARLVQQWGFTGIGADPEFHALW